MTPHLRSESLLAILVIGAFGLAAVVLVPPAITFDGPSHYFRALQVSRGQWRAERYSSRAVGGALPSAHVDFVDTLWNSYWVEHDFGSLSRWSALSRKASAETGAQRVEFTNTAVYSPVNYALQALGMRLMSWMTPSPLAAHRAACATNLVGYLAVIVTALGLMPRYRRGLLLVASYPLIVIQSASLSTDAINAALPLLLLAWTWKLRDGAPGTRPMELGGLFLVGLLVALLKPTSLAALTCLVLLPVGCFGTRRRWFAGLGVFFLCALAAWYLWNKANLDVDVAGWFEPSHPPASEQKAWFLAHPLRFVDPFLYFLAHDLAPQWPHLYGDVGGWIPAGIQAFLGKLSLIFMVGLCGCGHWEGRADWAWAVGNVAQVFVIVAFTALTLWLSFGVPHLDRIPAFMGRYLFVAAAGLGIASAEASHRGLGRIRGALFWAALMANCAGLTAILVSIALRVA
jgi:hypothetical protein